jgi:hypothetical protein
VYIDSKIGIIHLVATSLIERYRMPGVGGTARNANEGADFFCDTST